MKKNKTKEPLLAMPFFDSEHKVDNKGFLKTLINKWGLSYEELEEDSQSFSIVINGEQLILGLVEAPIPSGDMTYVLSQNENRIYLPVLSGQITSHFIISLLSNTSDSILKFKLFTMVIDSFLENSNAIGVYLGDQGLIFSRSCYLNYSSELENDKIPIELWIFFGYSENEEGIKQFTRGLNLFGKPEIQIHDKDLDINEGYNLLFGIAKYVVTRNITLQEHEKLTFDNREYLISFSNVKQGEEDITLLIKPT